MKTKKNILAGALLVLLFVLGGTGCSNKFLPQVEPEASETVLTEDEASRGVSVSTPCSDVWNEIDYASKLIYRNGTIYYISDDGEVCSLYQSGGVWKNSKLTSSSTMDKAVSGYGLALDPSNTDIYYVGEDKKIKKIYWSYSLGKWVNYSFNSDYMWNSVASVSKLVYKNNKVYYISDDRLVCAIYKSGSKWYDARLSSIAPLAAKGRSLTVDEDGNIYYSTLLNGAICKLSWTGSRYDNIEYVHMWNTIYSTSDLVCRDGKIFYRSTQGYICAIYQSGGKWYDSRLTTSSQKCYYNSPLILDPDSSDIYYIDENQWLRRLSWSYSSNKWVNTILYYSGGYKKTLGMELVDNKLYFGRDKDPSIAVYNLN